VICENISKKKDFTKNIFEICFKSFIFPFLVEKRILKLFEEGKVHG